MKLAIKIIIGVVAVIGIALGAVFWFTSGMTDTANAFFTSVKTNDYDKARRYLAQEFRANTSSEALQKFLISSALDKFKEANWGNRSITSGQGELDGSIKTETGGTIPLKLKFVKEEGQWKIFAIHKPSAGLSEQAGLPSEPELVALTNESMLKFAQAVQAKDFSAFHEHVSRLWQKEYTPQKFNEVFKVFIDANINMVPAVQQTAPRFDDRPEIKDNILIIRGRYPTRPSQILFQLKYIYEGLSWKLVGTQVNIVPATQQ